MIVVCLFWRESTVSDLWSLVLDVPVVVVAG